MRHHRETGKWNPYKGILSRIHRPEIENQQVTTNSTRLLKHQMESDRRVRFRNQHAHGEEERLRKVIALRYPNQEREFDIAPRVARTPSFANLSSGEFLRGPRHWFEGVIHQAGFADFTGHDPRPTFTSRLVMARTDLQSAAEFMGYRTIQMTMRHGHLEPEHKLLAVDQIASFAKPRQKSNATNTSTSRNAVEENLPKNGASH